MEERGKECVPHLFNPTLTTGQMKAAVRKFPTTLYSKHCRKFQSSEFGARTLQTDRRTEYGRRHIAVANMNVREYTFVSSRSLKRLGRVRTSSSSGSIIVRQLSRITTMGRGSAHRSGRVTELRLDSGMR